MLLLPNRLRLSSGGCNGSRAAPKQKIGRGCRLANAPGEGPALPRWQILRYLQKYSSAVESLSQIG